MGTYEEVTIIGNVGKDATLRTSKAGKPVATLNVAVTRTYVDVRGEKIQNTTWYNVTVGGQQAEWIGNNTKKGALVLVKGKPMSDNATGGPKIWTRTDGTPGASYDILADQVRILKSQSQPGTESYDF